jgi:hypothetical protein
MATRTFGFLFACAVLVATEAKVASKRTPFAPTDIIYGTGELIYDIYSAGYDAVEGIATKHGIQAKVSGHLNDIQTKVSGHLGDDPLALACSKLGCQKKDITDKLGAAQAAMQQAKAQAYELGAKGHDLLQDFAIKIVTKFETHVPSYQGFLPKNFADLCLLALYALFVLYIVFRIVRFVVSTALAIFCCVCCCCCRRRKQGPAKDGKNSGKKGSADAKSSPGKQANAKGKAKK